MNRFVLVKENNKKAKILRKEKSIYLLEYPNGYTEIRFLHEVEDYNFFKKIWRDLKNG